MAALVPNGIRAQMVFKGVSGLPEDQYVNTFHFLRTGGTYSGVIGNIASYLFAFYDNVVPGSAVRLTSYMALNLIDNWEVRTYDLEQGSPRTPTIIPGPAFVGTQNVLSNEPEEVSLCMSFHGAAPVTARKRGRVFLGPFNQACNGSGGADPTPKPTTVLQDRVAAGGKYLVDADTSSQNWAWAVYSPTDATMHPVVDGWVDDAFDIQRRRGRSPESRMLFSSS